MENQIKEALDAKFKSLQEELAAAQEKSATKDEIQKLHDEIEKSGNALEEFINAQTEKKIKTVGKELNEFIEDKHDEIKGLMKAGHGHIEFIPKAVGDISTGSGTVATGEGPSPNQDAVVTPPNLRNDNALMGLMTVSNISRAYYSYTETVPKDGDYTFVAEGATKPQIDFKWETRYPKPKKIAAHLVLTEESVQDVVGLQSTARTFLRQRHDLFKVNGLFFADGTGDNPTGATVYGRTFVAGTMAAKVPAPVNIMDVINAAVTDVYTTQGFADEAHYQPNVAMVNPVDFFLNFVAAKDTRGLPLYPQAGLFNQVTLGGVTIRPWIKIPAGKLFVADMSKYMVMNYIPFSVRIGWINDQFIKNTFTMVGESRFFQFVKNLDQAAFVYDDIATISGAIAKP